MAKTSAAGIRAGDIEEHLMNALQYGGLDKQNLAEIVRIVSRFNQSGVRPVKAFPIGIPYPDGVAFQSLLDREGLHTLLKVIVDTPRVSGIRIFPKGIPVPDIFLAETRIR